ncbi:MAG: hypothetical protein [Bacteriophage sp.]|nr:MAG: hypothetical protein [Bacteriophage sp.]
MPSKNPNESILGIKNFKNEYTSIVQSLSDITPINPVTENMNDPSTFNTRFLQLAQGIRHSFNAAGEIAIRDKKYLETFLSGYTNPIVANTIKITNINFVSYDNNSAFDINGNLIRFAENKVMLNISILGQLNVNASFIQVFINGKLAEPTEYDVYNTSYGIKCFVDKSSLSVGSTVSVTINRKYNINTITNSMKSVTIANNVSSASYVFPTNSFGTWYHTDYLKVYVKRNGVFSIIPKNNLILETDVAGGNVKVSVTNYNLLINDQLYIFNTLFWWEYNYKGAINTVPTSIILKDSTSNLPIPFLSSYDFDIYLDGLHLVPEVHYTVIESGTTEGFPVLKLFLDDAGVNSTKPSRLYITKNESCPKATLDAVYVETLDNNYNLLMKSKNSLIPFMSDLGSTYAAGYYIPNQDLRVLQRETLYLTTNTKKRDLYNQTRIVYTYDIKNIIENAKNSVNEYEQIINLIGRDNFLNYLAENGNISPVNLATFDQQTISDKLFGANGFWKYNPNYLVYTSENLEYYMSIRNGQASPLLVDSNSTTDDSAELNNYIEGSLYLNSNITKTNPDVYDSNIR